MYFVKKKIFTCILGQTLNTLIENSPTITFFLEQGSILYHHEASKRMASECLFISASRHVWLQLINLSLKGENIKPKC